MKKKEKWMKFRHKVAWIVLRPILTLVTVIKFPIRVKKHRDQWKRPYLILMNHQTPFDQFFVGMAFKGPIYFIATEDLLSNGFISKVIRYLLAPIPIKKQAGDFSAVMTALRVAREGATICMAPEGNRTYSGQTEYINPAIASLAKKLGLPIALFRIEGGYGKQPRWSDVIRKGKMRAYVSKVIEPEEYKDLKPDALCKMISDGLYVNEACADAAFEHPQRAEYLERAIYVCPHCGLSVFESSGDTMTCKQCGLKIRHLPTKVLEAVEGELPFTSVGQWYDYQSDFVNALDTREFTETPLFRDTASLSEVIVYHLKELRRKEASIALYGDRVVIDEGRADEMILPFEEVTALAVLGRNKANIYHDGRVWQLKGDKRFNALKYVQLYYRNKNICRGEENAKFVGL